MLPPQLGGQLDYRCGRGYEGTRMSCVHQFSWPRRCSNGAHYQVCLECGEEYAYDWDTMQRLGRRQTQGDSKVAAQQPELHWVPRARRLRLSPPLRYRNLRTQIWINGEAKNISSSGVLFASAYPVAVGTAIEIELQMPPDICGGSVARKVRCVAAVTRIAAGREGNIAAARIQDYVFLTADTDG